MANLRLPYGKGAVELSIPDRNLLGIVEGKEAERIEFEQAFRDAWESPIGLDDPAAFFHPGESVVFVVTDHTRSTPTRKVFPLVWERIRTQVRPEDVTLLVATGTHRSPTEEELEGMLGEIRHEFCVRIHDCDHDLVEVGKSSRGTPILLNRLVAEADRVVTIGHIGMHYFAGYSGGPKNILPGVAGREMIETNHSQFTDPRCEGCIYVGNPISEEMSEVARLIGVDFIVDVVLDVQGRVAKVVVGDVEEAHAVGRAFWDTLFQVKVSEQADLVIVSAGGHPKDIDLYQAHKAIYNAARAVKDGGMIFLLAACPDGIGHEVFTDWMMRCDKPDDVFGIFAKEGFKIGGHKALYLAKDLRRAEIYLLSEMKSDLVRRLFLEPVADQNDVLAAARERFGERFRTLVMPHGGDTFPVT